MLRERGVPLERAVMRCLKHLRERFGPPGPRWATARIVVQGHDVFVLAQDDWPAVETTRGGQVVAEVLLGEEFARLRERGDALLVPNQFQTSVEIRPDVRSGLPVVRGTTVQTAVLYRLRRRGLSPRQIHDAYPHVTPSQIKGAIAFEQFLDHEAV